MNYESEILMFLSTREGMRMLLKARDGLKFEKILSLRIYGGWLNRNRE